MPTKTADPKLPAGHSPRSPRQTELDMIEVLGRSLSASGGLSRLRMEMILRGWHHYFKG
jgi:hypothetical protein